MITVIITSYDELQSTINAVKKILSQNITDLRVIVAEPFEDNLWEIEAAVNDKRVTYYQDEGKGKSHTLNQLLKKYYSEDKNDIFVFTDGDVYIGGHTLQALLEPFTDSTVGAACGRLVSLNKKDNILGYWSHLFFNEFNNTRKELSEQKKYLEVTGYLFALRNGILKEFPEKASEDKIIPTLLWNKGYRVAYAEKAETYVMNPQTNHDRVIQKKRNLKGVLQLKKQELLVGQRSNLFGEALRGLRIFRYPRTIKEFLWTLLAFPARLHVWFLAYYDTYFKKEEYKDGWREELTKTTRIMD